MIISIPTGWQFRYMTTSVHISILVHMFFGICFSVHQVNIGTFRKKLRSMSGMFCCRLQMLNMCLACYVQHTCATERGFMLLLLCCNQQVTQNDSNWQIRFNKHVTSAVGLRDWGLLKGHHAPAMSQCRLQMLQLGLLQNHRRKRCLKSWCCYIFSYGRLSWLQSTSTRMIEAGTSTTGLCR